MFQLYIRTKLEFESLLLSNENVKRVMETVEENERMMRMMDPSYKEMINVSRKKNIKNNHIMLKTIIIIKIMPTGNLIKTTIKGLLSINTKM